MYQSDGGQTLHLAAFTITGTVNDGGEAGAATRKWPYCYRGLWE